MKLRMPTTAMPGAESGKTMRQKEPKVEQPSTQAASSRSIDTESRKFFIIQVLNGSEEATKKATTPGVESVRPSCTYMAYRGKISARTGKPVQNRISSITVCFRRNW